MKKGQLIAFEEGAYSDYGVIGFFRVLKNFDLQKELILYKAAKNQDDRIGVSPTSFVAYLSEWGFIEDVDYQSVWLGAYGDLELEIYN